MSEASLTIIRHGESNWNAEGRQQGHLAEMEKQEGRHRQLRGERRCEQGDDFGGVRAEQLSDRAIEQDGPKSRGKT